ncbi:helix-turn-helix domain-containing protein [Brevibacillus dissolubilis]|uniref:helix-turn-helix domain-containing protein n=1 Tax=Brevibacillus dissolubilis TaxID=1844116 RepID=UPI0011166CF5|nr:helix-turn-helix domain-containing protein [Brevibacillus dissolubilis]
MNTIHRVTVTESDQAKAMEQLLAEEVNSQILYDFFSRLLSRIDSEQKFLPKAQEILRFGAGNPRLALEYLFITLQQETHAVPQGFSHSVRTYTTGELAQFFGVSITTIHKWLKNDRIQYEKPVDKAKHQHTRIPEQAIWISPTGERFTIRRIAEMYVEEQQKGQETQSLSIENEIENLKIKFQADSYEVLATRPNLTSEERHGLLAWKYLMGRLQDRSMKE